MDVTERIKFNKLKEENEALKKELTELKEQQLFKVSAELVDEIEELAQLKNNSLYYKLPSKEEK
ncbi:hypothetical protein [Spiroplasma citri]|uniref:Uncharacterized protein n=1 Tax=Spiroplasma citri TaxID=2133 RepID=A0AAJ4EI16_SPICI|nr:hypothetical protein [Spiroplasma citri]APE74105.1 hypothetical protein SCITRI_00191 [Spiroplasma citri]QED24088.1 hypothetical protein FRX96_00820 [Spiroplasma citri]QIA66367.1 hypothetical protein GMI18_00895 [Spiroplasma citri]QIA68243.1 hypothetical protein GL298_01010 [Spiroplasma citri]QIA70118.1 hypothetical protein GL981_01015 [Spiroplasma citri]